MDLLVEKLDGSRYYLSQYKVLITDFEESAPSVTRNSTQLDQRNGNIDFGGWHTDKTINITGYYRADDIDEEETLRERLYALLSDPNGYYITQLKISPESAVERPGETSGSYYDKLSNYPSHKRFLVYTEAPEMELVGNVGGTLLYKLTAEFKTIKLPYGESVPLDLNVKPNVPYYGRNLLKGSRGPFTPNSNPSNYDNSLYTNIIVYLEKGTTYTISASSNGNFTSDHEPNTESDNIVLWLTNSRLDNNDPKFSTIISSQTTGTMGTTFTWRRPSVSAELRVNAYHKTPIMNVEKVKLEKGSVATPWAPAPEDSEYNEWYYDTYYNTDNLFIPYAGTVPCNQLEQGFAIELTAKDASSSLSFKIDDTELTYSGAVAAGDVFIFSGFSYTQNGLSIVSKTNKAYFILQPDKPNRITCNVPGTVRILGFQNLYA